MSEPANLPDGHFFAGLKRNGYSVILTDPPWSFETRSEAGQGRSPSRHYPTRPILDIMADPVADLAAPDCHLFMWVTCPLVAKGIHAEVMRGWGFEPSSVAFVWIKTNDPDSIRYAETWEQVLWAGGGFTTRQNAELIMLGRRGSPKRMATDVRQVIVAPRREHSRKPIEAVKRIERYTGTTGVELYCRSRRPGWDVFGNDLDKFAEAV